MVALEDCEESSKPQSPKRSELEGEDFILSKSAEATDNCCRHC